MKALLIVDVQNDFCSGGNLEVPEGEKVVPVINNLMGRFELKLASKDWHPEKSSHFNEWPLHCVQNTPGAEFHNNLNTHMIDEVCLKGTGLNEDGYSAFDATNVNLNRMLQDQKVDELYICGLATDYCVKSTVIDAIKKGFKVFLIEDATRGVNLNDGDVEKAKETMKNMGAILINSDQVLLNGHQ